MKRIKRYAQVAVGVGMAGLVGLSYLQSRGVAVPAALKAGCGMAFALGFAVLAAGMIFGKEGEE